VTSVTPPQEGEKEETEGERKAEDKKSGVPNKNKQAVYIKGDIFS
jgi:hypothetical protein